VFNLLAAGYVPIIAHPERQRWIDQGYEMFKRLVGNGAWMQVTAGSLTGRFGKSAKSSLQNIV
jgi:protein-tyrosine phosphatase